MSHNLGVCSKVGNEQPLSLYCVEIEIHLVNVGL